MREDHTTWIVVADGRAAQVYEERARNGRLHALADFNFDAEHAAQPQAQHGHRATVHSRHGPGRHGAGERDLPQAREARFLDLVAERLESAAIAGRFEGLVVVAAPRALGLLRASLGPHAASRLELTDPHDRTSLDGDALRDTLRAARRSA